MSDTVTGAVEKTPTRLIEASAPEFAKILPAHIGPDKFARWSLSVIRNGVKGGATEQARKARENWLKVLDSEPGRLSLMAALMDCASLGLEPGREYHLVPFGGEVSGITDYKGEIRLICNADPAACVVAQLVRKGDEFHMRGANVPPKHEADWFGVAGSRGPVIGGYAYVDYGGRYSQVVRMREAPDPDDPTVDSFQHHKAKAKTAALWDEWPEAMRLKTLVHQLRKWVPWSAEVRA